MPLRRTPKGWRRWLRRWSIFWLLTIPSVLGITWLVLTMADGWEAHQQQQQEQAQ